MAYSRHTWVDGEIITEEKLNNIEEGIAEAKKAQEDNAIAGAELEAIKKHVDDTENPHKVTKKQVGLENVPNVSTNDQTPTYSDIDALAELSSGEKLSAAFPKIKLAISRLMSHLLNQQNPHAVTLKQLGVEKTADELNSMGTGDYLEKKGGTMTGALVAQNNTNYTTKQVRNIFLVADGANLPSGANGDICLVYTP